MASDNYDDRGRGYDDRDRDDRRGDDALDIQDAKKKLKPPAIGLIVAAVLSIGLAGWGLYQMFDNFDARWDDEVNKAVAQQPGANADQLRDMMDKIKPMIKTYVPILHGLQIVFALLIIFGATRMLGVSSAGWSKAAAILAIVPVHGCLPWVLGMIFGIMALVAMSKPEVKRAFALNGRKASGGGADAGDDRWSDTGR